MSGVIAALGASAGVAITISLSPGDQATSGATSSFTFSAETVTASSGSPSSYTWSIINTNGGSWSITAGQGTATGTARVTGLTSGDTFSATFQRAVVIAGTTYYGDCYLERSRP